MRVPTQAGRRTIGFNMTPMIDIVMLLIIFFIVSSHLAQQETQMELALPSAATGEEPDLDNTRRLVVNVLPSGEVLLAGSPTAHGELEAKIRYEVARSTAPLEVRVRGDRHVAYEHVEPVLVACAKSGIWKVSFAVVERRE